MFLCSVKVDSGSSVKGWHGHALDPPGGNTGVYHQYLEILNTTSKDILMGIMAVIIGKIQKDPSLGEWTVRNVDRVKQGFHLVEMCITDLMNIDHLPQI